MLTIWVSGMCELKGRCASPKIQIPAGNLKVKLSTLKGRVKNRKVGVTKHCLGIVRDYIKCHRCAQLQLLKEPVCYHIPERDGDPRDHMEK